MGHTLSLTHVSQSLTRKNNTHPFKKLKKQCH